MSSGGSHSSGALFHEEEEHENHERYLITYADMITLLMALFIILFAIGQVDLQKFARFREGLHETFGTSPVVAGGAGMAYGTSFDPIPVGVRAGEGDEERGTGDDDGNAEVTGTYVSAAEADDLADVLSASLLDADIDASVLLDERGVVVTLSTDDVTFDSGSWTLLPRGARAIDAVAHILEPLNNDIQVAGHTDAVPMAPPLTNWELSTNRAAAVVRRLLDRDISAERLSAQGFADTRPLADNGTAAGRAVNRRVEIVVVVDIAGAIPAAYEIDPFRLTQDQLASQR